MWRRHRDMWHCARSQQVAFAHANLQAYDLGSHFQLVENMHRSTLVCRLLRVDSIEESDDRIKS
jgi:hypothetical protein